MSTNHDDAAALAHLAAHPRKANSTYVVTEETAIGHAARHLGQTNPGHMHRGHDLWNVSREFEREG